jgi:hypothetical protein
MATPTNVNFAKRYSRSFDVVNPQAFTSPFFFMAASTSGSAGQVVMYDTTEDTVKIATSGLDKFQVAGFLMQDVKDLDAGPVKGYRNLNNTTANMGDPVGVHQGYGVAFTKIYAGSPALKDKLGVNGNGYLYSTSGNVAQSDILAVVEAVASSLTPSNEPSQTGASATDYIRIRIV